MDSRALLYIGVFILIVSAALYYFSVGYNQKITAKAVGPFDLNAAKDTISFIDAQPFYTEGQGTVSMFLNIKAMNRTGSYSPCGSGSGQICDETGAFPPCLCDASTGDCSKCDHSGYTPVLNISGLVGLEILTAPDASRQGMAMSQLTVKTEGLAITSSSSTTPPTQSQKYIETLRLPPIPLQKWIMVSIAREGRRFDVYYNDRIVLSQKTMYMPVSDKSNSNLKGITSGSTLLMGEAAVANIYNYRVSSYDVSAKYKEYADTRGSPLISHDLVSSFSLNLCPSGGCFDTPVIKPASPLYEWTSPYS
jgi:hypothetical protein